ncbi:hypothetical protein B0J12DRAFT_86570 [Macrophomina phaseolina]|uniref:Secreted protein n=1 Tax=Macrophomina phaseolina TaxID=35725 RepID=A0ABQ8GAA7_9PEZI|nr:hypothetical protein B0J12DRAFT_86570 [Macrophomina phaseolina]
MARSFALSLSFLFQVLRRAGRISPLRTADVADIVGFAHSSPASLPSDACWCTERASSSLALSALTSLHCRCPVHHQPRRVAFWPSAMTRDVELLGGFAPRLTSHIFSDDVLHSHFQTRKDSATPRIRAYRRFVVQ